MIKSDVINSDIQDMVFILVHEVFEEADLSPSQMSCHEKNRVKYQSLLKRHGSVLKAD